MAGQRQNRFIRFARDPGNRKLLVTLAVTTLLLMVAIANLVAVSQDPVVVEPEEYRETEWTLGSDGPDPPPSRLQWDFVVDPGTRRVVDLDLRIPMDVRVEHREGESWFSSLLLVHVDGERVDLKNHRIHVPPERSGETWTDRTDLGRESARLVVERSPTDGPFLVRMTLDWSHGQDPVDATRFDVSLGPVTVEPADLRGIPGCSHPTCAQVLLVVAFVVQGAAVFWVMNRFQSSSASDREPPPPAKPRGSGGTDKKK